MTERGESVKQCRKLHGILMCVCDKYMEESMVTRKLCTDVKMNEMSNIRWSVDASEE